MKRLIYCLRCRQPTHNKGKIIITSTNNGKPIAKTNCAKCGSIKNRFLKKKDIMPIVGGNVNESVVSKFINALPFEAHLRDIQFNRSGLKKIIPRIRPYSFCGEPAPLY